MEAAARRLMARLDEFAAFTDEPGQLTRLYLSPAHRKACDLIVEWAREAGLEAHIDAAGNVHARHEGRTPGAPALMIGSHIDTVRDAGRYDGNLGALAGMLFVRCHGGVSHNPRESISLADCETALDVLLQFVRDFSPEMVSARACGSVAPEGAGRLRGAKGRTRPSPGPKRRRPDTTCAIEGRRSYLDCRFTIDCACSAIHPSPTSQPGPKSLVLRLGVGAARTSSRQERGSGALTSCRTCGRRRRRGRARCSRGH